MLSNDNRVSFLCFDSYTLKKEERFSAEKQHGSEYTAEEIIAYIKSKVDRVEPDDNRRIRLPAVLLLNSPSLINEEQTRPVCIYNLVTTDVST